MKNDKILARLDSMMTRIGSSLIGVNTESSDFDFATSLSVWDKIFPILVNKLGFNEFDKYDGSALKYKNNNKYNKHSMFNIDNVQMIYDGYTYDFIIYDGDNILKVNEATRKFVSFLHDVPSVKRLITDKLVRIEIFQYFLHHEFSTIDRKTDEELLDDIFAGM